MWQGVQYPAANECADLESVVYSGNEFSRRPLVKKPLRQVHKVSVKSHDQLHGGP